VETVQIHHYECETVASRRNGGETVAQRFFQEAAVEQTGKCILYRTAPGGFTPPYQVVKEVGGLVEPGHHHSADGGEHSMSNRTVFENQVIEIGSFQNKEFRILFSPALGGAWRTLDNCHLPEKAAGTKFVDRPAGSVGLGHTGPNASGADDEDFFALVTFFENDAAFGVPALFEESVHNRYFVSG
jgi:hypothetical protein